jgi:hypothetical protein
MIRDVNSEPIPLEVALELCAEIRQEAEDNWHTAAATWCFTCQQQTGGDPAKRGFLRAEANRGCYLVNNRYAALALQKQ